MPILSPRVTLQIVITTNCNATRGDKFGIITTLCLRDNYLTINSESMCLHPSDPSPL